MTGEGLQWSAETSTLVRTDRDLETGDRIDIVSAMPSFTADVLRGTSSDQPPDPIYLTLPDGFPETVAATAAAVTEGAPTNYDAMLALQNWFQTQFRYSLDVPAGHSNSAIEAFLRQRVGYCEQFAGTFAAMARDARHPVTARRRLHPGPAALRRVVQRHRPQLPRLAGGLVRRHRLGPVRADARARHPRCRELHRRRRRARRVDSRRPHAGRGCGHAAAHADDGVLAADNDPAPHRRLTPTHICQFYAHSPRRAADRMAPVGRSAAPEPAIPGTASLNSWPLLPDALSISLCASRTTDAGAGSSARLSRTLRCGGVASMVTAA